MLNNEGAIPPVIGFISGIFQDNPKSVSAWVAELSSLDDKYFGVVVLGLWYANLPTSQTQVYSFLETRPKLKSDYGSLYSGSPMVIESIPLEQGPWVLDALWGKFMATGRDEPVERIITALPWRDIKGDLNRLMVGGSAKWSLTSNAIQHPRVLQICEKSLKFHNSEDTEKLREVIEAAKKGKKERHPSP